MKGILSGDRRQLVIVNTLRCCASFDSNIVIVLPNSFFSVFQLIVKFYKLDIGDDSTRLLVFAIGDKKKETENNYGIIIKFFECCQVFSTVFLIINNKIVPPCPKLCPRMRLQCTSTTERRYTAPLLITNQYCISLIIRQLLILVG